MSEQKTRPTSASVGEFLAAVPQERRRADAADAVELLREITGAEPAMWGPSIVGFGSYHYRYASGREGDAPRLAVSPRASALTFYGLQERPRSRVPARAPGTAHGRHELPLRQVARRAGCRRAA